MSGSWIIYTLQNTGTAPCSLSGVPTLTVMSRSGRALPIAEHQPYGAGTAVNLPPGGVASFSVHWQRCLSWSRVPSQLQGVPNPAITTWTFPGQVQSVQDLAVDATLGCTHQRVEVSPVQASVMTTPAGVPPQYVGAPIVGTPLPRPAVRLRMLRHWQLHHHLVRGNR
jgi:hypothetical protein